MEYFLLFHEHCVMSSQQPVLHGRHVKGGQKEHIDWVVTCAQRNSSWIPPRASDVMLRTHCLTLQTATRLHNDLIPLACFGCKRPRPSSFFPSLLSSSSPSPSSSPPLGQHSLVDDPPLSLHPSRFTGLDQDDVQESLSHCLLTCPRVFPIVQSLKRILRIHCGVSISYESVLLFSCSSLPADGFPLFLLQSLSFYHLWIARCESRFNSKRFHPKALLQIILSSFLNHCTSHFSHLCNSTSKSKKKLLLSHRKAAVKFSVLTFPSPSIPVLHPLFKRHWLLCEPFHPP